MSLEKHRTPQVLSCQQATQWGEVVDTDNVATCGEPASLTPNGVVILAEFYRTNFSEIHLGRDTIRHEQVVCKSLRSDLDEETRKEYEHRLAREVSFLKRCTHPNIVVYHSHGQFDDGRPYLVTEYTAGGTLREFLHGSPLGPQISLDLLSDIAAGLERIHDEGLVHRDIKPENVVIDDMDGRAIICDLGLACDVVRPSNLTRVGRLAGTTEYLAPEIRSGEKATIQSDIYSFACLAVELLSGHLPVGYWYNNFTPAVRTVLEKGLSNDPAKRYSSALTFFADVRDAILATPASHQNRKNIANWAAWTMAAAIAGLAGMTLLF